MVDSNEAYESLMRCDSSVQTLQAEIRDRILVLAAEGKQAGVTFPFEEHGAFVKRWNAYKAQTERTKGWWFQPPETLDQIAIYWKKNQEWRKRAEADMSLPPPVVQEIPPVKPPPPDDPSRRFPYATEIKIGLAVGMLYLVARILGKV